jgi:RNA polymerase sigma-70 factor (TIGR02960 family)
VHCYRMVGSFTDAEDIVQDTLLRAWKARDGFDAASGEIGMRRWLYRIATNACLDFLKSANRRVQSLDSVADLPWLQPYPDRFLDAPDAAIENKETIALGYLAVIQLLPPQQRAVFVLRDVLGWSAQETAELLEMTVAAANSSLQRARETIDKHRATTHAPTDVERDVLQRFITAHERGDEAASIAMMCKDMRVAMPPNPGFMQGVESIVPLMRQAMMMGEWKLVPMWMNGMPAAVSYLKQPGDTEFRAFKIDVLRVRDDGLVQEITTFDPRPLHAAFGIEAVLR